MARTKVEDSGPGGAPAHDFATGDLSGTYVGSKQITTQFGEKALHSFDTADGPRVIFGRAMLTRLLVGLEGKNLDVVETGRKIKTKAGGAMKEYEVYINE